MTVLALAVLLIFTATIFAALVFGAVRWKIATNKLLFALNSAQISSTAKFYSEHELKNLPAPVQRYFRKVLKDGQAIISKVTLTHTGYFNMNESGDQWAPFTSTQNIVSQRHGFDWEARITLFKLLTVRVHDAYIAGEGILVASLFGLKTLAYFRGTSELAIGELMRFLAESVWHPTSLLPSQGISWQAVNDNFAKATITDNKLKVTLLFQFNNNALIASVKSEARGRLVKNIITPTPWEGHFKRYEIREGMLIPIEGEVAWILPEGQRPYWRGTIVELNYRYS